MDEDYQLALLLQQELNNDAADVIEVLSTYCCLSPWTSEDTTVEPLSSFRNLHGRKRKMIQGIT